MAAHSMTGRTTENAIPFPFPSNWLDIERANTINRRVRQFSVDAGIDDEAAPMDVLLRRGYDWVHTHFTKLPYHESDEKAVADELSKRWRESVSGIAERMSGYDGKYCTQVCLLYNAIFRAQAYRTWFVRLIKPDASLEEGYRMHAISLVEPITAEPSPIVYAVNAGSPNYWTEKISRPPRVPSRLSFPDIPPIRDWHVWRITTGHQWSLGLYTHKDTQLMLKEAERFFKSRASHQ